MKYHIFQINMDGTGRDKAFLPFHSLCKSIPDPAHYNMVYEGTLDSEPLHKSIAYHLERLFCIFNMSHPQDYTGRSMSVSDVIEITEDSGKITCYYVDTIGFKKLEPDNPFYGMNPENKAEEAQ